MPFEMLQHVQLGEQQQKPRKGTILISIGWLLIGH